MANGERKTNEIQNNNSHRARLLNIRLNYVTSVLVIAKEIQIKPIGCTARTNKKCCKTKLMTSKMLLW